jgi:prepilin-type processing-associated H-X9-DG protein
MNTIGIALLWCAVQVTLLAFIAGVLYGVVRRFRPAAGMPVVLAGLVTVVLLSLLALSPWPRWADSFAPSADASAAIAKTPATDVATAPSAPAASQPAAGKAVAPPAGPSTAALFWQLLRESLSRPRAETTAPGWRWQATAGVILLAAMALGLTWLTLGIAAVRRERRRGRPVGDAELAELIDVLCAELDCRRQIEVRQCDGLTTAATVGWRRPVILLPGDWPHWTDAQRRAVLAHEIAHVRSRDFASLIFGQIGLVLHYYHPLVHWLMGRLRLEQELAADAAAASVCGGQRNYLVTIAEIALGRQERPMLWPARAFLPTQTTFLRRIAVLRDSKLRIDRLSLTARLTAVGIVLLCGLFIAGLRGPAGPSPARADDAATQKPSSATAENDNAPIDLSFVPATAQGIMVIRPAEAARRPELAPLVKLLERSGEVVPQGTRLADFRQITAVFMSNDRPASDQMVIIYQSHQRLNPASLSLAPWNNLKAEKTKDEKQMYTNNNRVVALQYDDRTAIFAFTEKTLDDYLAANRGVLPAWLPRKVWKPFENDHYLMAGDMAFVRKDLGHHSPLDAAVMPFSPLYENTKSVIAGVRFADTATVHAAALAKDEAGAEKVKQTAEAAVVLAKNSLDAYQKAVESMPPSPTTEMLDLSQSVLAQLKIERDGLQVRARSEFELSEIQGLIPEITQARGAAQNMQSQNNLKQLALGMLNYESARKHFPPAVLYGPDGKTPYSWRVALLPYMEQKALYDQYRFDEPWDGPNNRKLLTMMPRQFRCPTEPANSQNACYFALTGPGTLFDGKEGTRMKEIRDGTSNTLMLVEAKRDIPWTKPEDIPYDPDQPLPKLGGFFQGKFNFTFADGSVRTLLDTINEKAFRSLITKAGGEMIEGRWIELNR